MADLRDTHEGMFDPQGRFVPMSLIKPLDRTRHDLVCEIVARAKKASAALAEFKIDTLADVGAFVELSAEQYDVHIGGKKGNITLYSFDGQFKVQRQIAEHIVFDERLQVAKALIDACIDDWATNVRDELRVLVNDAFQVNKEGKISTTRVLGLRRLDISDEKWRQAMVAIGDSIQVAGSKTYLRVYERIGESDQYRPISLDLAVV